MIYIVKEEVIKKLFDLVKQKFLVGIPENYQSKILSSYYYDVFSRYGKAFDTLTKKGFSQEKILKIFYKSESLFIQGISLNQKIKIYIKDEALEKLYLSSMKAYDIATHSFSMKIKSESAEELDKLSSDISDNVERVKLHNKGVAARLASEGLLDVRYATSGGMATSFRLARYIRDQQNRPPAE